MTLTQLKTEVISLLQLETYNLEIIKEKLQKLNIHYDNLSKKQSWENIVKELQDKFNTDNETNKYFVDKNLVIVSQEGTKVKDSSKVNNIIEYILTYLNRYEIPFNEVITEIQLKLFDEHTAYRNNSNVPSYKKAVRGVKPAIHTNRQKTKLAVIEGQEATRERALQPSSNYIPSTVIKRDLHSDFYYFQEKTDKLIRIDTKNKYIFNNKELKGLDNNIPDTLLERYPYGIFYLRLNNTVIVSNTPKVTPSNLRDKKIITKRKNLFSNLKNFVGAKSNKFNILLNNTPIWARLHLEGDVYLYSGLSSDVNVECSTNLGKVFSIKQDTFNDLTIKYSLNFNRLGFSINTLNSLKRKIKQQLKDIVFNGFDSKEFKIEYVTDNNYNIYVPSNKSVEIINAHIELKTNIRLLPEKLKNLDYVNNTLGITENQYIDMFSKLCKVMNSIKDSELLGFQINTTIPKIYDVKGNKIDNHKFKKLVKKILNFLNKGYKWKNKKWSFTLAHLNKTPLSEIEIEDLTENILYSSLPKVGNTLQCLDDRNKTDLEYIHSILLNFYIHLGVQLSFYSENSYISTLDILDISKWVNKYKYLFSSQQLTLNEFYFTNNEKMLTAVDKDLWEISNENILDKNTIKKCLEELPDNWELLGNVPINKLYLWS